MDSGKAKIQLATDLKQFFEEQVRETAAKQGCDMSPMATAYLATLLNKFSDANNYLQTFPPQIDPSAVALATESKERKSLPILAFLWFDSLGQNPAEQFFTLQHLGDVALFTSGYFNQSIAKSMADMDYYTAMGENAYEQVGKIRESLSAERSINVYFELSERFRNFVEVFAELSDQALLAESKANILKLYERWLNSRSQRLERMLAENGIIAKGRNPTDIS